MMRRLRDTVARDGLALILRDVAIAVIAGVGSFASCALAYLAGCWLFGVVL